MNDEEQTEKPATLLDEQPKTENKLIFDLVTAVILGVLLLYIVTR